MEDIHTTLGVDKSVLEQDFDIHQIFAFLSERRQGDNMPSRRKTPERKSHQDI